MSIRRNLALLAPVLMASTAFSEAPKPAAAPAPVTAPAGWKMVWSDEFNGKELDFNKWSVEENGNGGGNNELQYYVDRPENVRVEDGCLVIEARKEKYAAGGLEKNFTSGRIRTKRHASWTYGRYEIRAKLPTGRGVWPALWMLPEKEKYGGWAASGEIDIMEMLGQEPDKVYGTLHYGGSWPKNVHTGEPFKLEKGTFADDFHIFALEWEKGEIRWYVDGKLYQTQKKWNSDGAAFPAPFDQPFFFVINLAVGGGWPGPPDDKTVFPQKLLVDYVRVFEKAP